jgi:hypothetical protein
LSRRKYASLEEYLTWDQDCEVCCTVCNWMFEKGKKPCPVCHDIYIHWSDDMCQGCWDELHPVEAQKRMAGVRQRARERKQLKAALIQREKEKVKKWKSEHLPHKNNKRTN